MNTEILEEALNEVMTCMGQVQYWKTETVMKV